MKRIFALVLAALLALGLTGCQDGKSVMGRLVEVRTAEDGSLSALVLELDGKRTGVLLAEKTSVWPWGEGSWTGEEAMEAFRKDLQPGNELSAWCYPRREKLETAEGESIPAYWGQSIHIAGILTRNALTLRDGTAVDIMENGSHGDNRTYQLPDGTELLRVTDSGGPENHYVMGQESLHNLNESVQRKIQAYYDAQEPLYDEEEELEKSYAAYLRLGEEFHCDWIQRDVTPCASSERVLYFLTSLTLPLEHGGRTSYNLQLGAAFDRETGEKFSNWDLFGVPEAEVRRRLPELCEWAPGTDWPENMMEVLNPDWIVFFPESVSIDFPPGTLEGEPYNYGFGVNYRDAPEGFFRPWAIPAAREE